MESDSTAKMTENNKENIIKNADEIK